MTRAFASFARGSKTTFIGVAKRLPGERFQFCPSHWSMCSQTVWPSARANFV